MVPPVRDGSEVPEAALSSPAMFNVTVLRVGAVAATLAVNDVKAPALPLLLKTVLLKTAFPWKLI